MHTYKKKKEKLENRTIERNRYQLWSSNFSDREMLVELRFALQQKEDENTNRNKN